MDPQKEAVVAMGLDDPTPAYLTPQQASRFLGLRERTLGEWRRRGIGPRYSRIGGRPNGRVRYSVADLHNWMAGQVTKRNGASR